jgi:hypothetical protein
VKPDAFAAVMAAGIVSIAAADHGYRIVSQILLVVAAVALPLLVVMVATSWRQESWDITDLDVALGLSTYVAACAVLALAGAVWWPGGCGVTAAICAHVRMAVGSLRALQRPDWPSCQPI